MRTFSGWYHWYVDLSFEQYYNKQIIIWSDFWEYALGTVIILDMNAAPDWAWTVIQWLLNNDGYKTWKFLLEICTRKLFRYLPPVGTGISCLPMAARTPCMNPSWAVMETTVQKKKKGWRLNGSFYFRGWRNFLIHCASISFWNITSKTFRARSATCFVDSRVVGSQSSSDSVNPSSKTNRGKDEAMYVFGLRLSQVDSPCVSRQFWNIEQSIFACNIGNDETITYLDNGNRMVIMLKNSIQHNVACVKCSA